jgi:hypothetical protein
MEHALNLAAGHVISHIVPIKPGKTHRAGASDDNKDNESSENDSDDDSGPTISDALRKLMGLIKQVCRIDRIYVTVIGCTKPSFRYGTRLKSARFSRVCVRTSRFHNLSS